MKISGGGSTGCACAHLARRQAARGRSLSSYRFSRTIHSPVGTLPAQRRCFLHHPLDDRPRLFFSTRSRHAAPSLAAPPAAIPCGWRLHPVHSTRGRLPCDFHRARPLLGIQRGDLRDVHRQANAERRHERPHKEPEDHPANHGRPHHNPGWTGGRVDRSAAIRSWTADLVVMSALSHLCFSEYPGPEGTPPGTCSAKRYPDGRAPAAQDSTAIPPDKRCCPSATGRVQGEYPRGRRAVTMSVRWAFTDSYRPIRLPTGEPSACKVLHAGRHCASGSEKFAL